MNTMQIMNTPELTRTNSAHAGTASLSSFADSAAVSSEKKLGTFESYLVDAVSAMNSQQLDVNTIQEKLITDPDSVDVHDVTTAMAKAQMSLSLAQTVIDRIITGWNEISTTR
jgi:flagellar hook-basal body complex protein FliE